MTCGIYLQEGNFINAGAHRIVRQVHLRGCAAGGDRGCSEGFEAIIKGENDWSCKTTAALLFAYPQN